MSRDPYFKLVVFWLLASIGFSTATTWIRMAGGDRQDALGPIIAAGMSFAAAAFFFACVLWRGRKRS